METLHNSEKYNIIAGIYGSIHDQDIEEKIKLLHYLKDKLTDNCCYERSNITSDSYMLVIIKY